MSPKEIERRVVETFIVPGRRERYFEALTSPKKRRKILDRLNHFVSDLDERYRVQIPKGTQYAEAIERALTARGAPAECYVISSSREFDGKAILLKAVLYSVVGLGIGTINSYIPGRLA